MKLQLGPFYAVGMSVCCGLEVHEAERILGWKEVEGE